MHGRTGFTLLDIVFAIAILVLSLVVGVPKLTYFFTKQQADTFASGALRQLALARELSINTGQTVTICGTRNGLECTDSNFAAIIVFLDENGNHRVDGDEQIEAVLDTNHAGSISSPGRIYFTYKPDGTSGRWGSFVYCPSTKNPKLIRRVTLYRTGRAYIAKDSNGDGVIATAGGDPISCW